MNDFYSCYFTKMSHLVTLYRSGYIIIKGVEKLGGINYLRSTTRITSCVCVGGTSRRITKSLAPKRIGQGTTRPLFFPQIIIYHKIAVPPLHHPTQ